MFLEFPYQCFLKIFFSLYYEEFYINTFKKLSSLDLTESYSRRRLLFENTSVRVFKKFKD